MLTRRSNVTPVLARWDDLDRLFRELSGDFPFLAARMQNGGNVEGGWFPALNVHDEGASIVVEAEIPGVDAKDFEITVKGNLLTISGEKKESSEKKEKNYHYTERRFGSFQRIVELPAEVDSEKVAAEYEKGVLKITLAKTGKEQPRKISVSVK